MRLAALLPLALLLLACTEGRSPLAGPTAPDAGPAPDATRPPPPKKRQKLPLPPMPEPPPRPEGEPQSPEDLARLSTAAGDGQPIAEPGAPPIQRLDAYRLRVGQVFVDRLDRFIEVPAKVNMKEGILEYQSVGSNGKLHESVLEIGAEPSHIHLGLLLIGLEPRQYSNETDPYKLPTITREGGRIELRVRYQDPATKTDHDIPAEAWLRDRKTGKAPPPQHWYFQGSMFWNGRYSADSDRSVVALIPDRIAVVVIGDDAGNPYQGDRLGYDVHTEAIPAIGTPARLVFKVHGAEPGKIPSPKPANAQPQQPSQQQPSQQQPSQQQPSPQPSQPSQPSQPPQPSQP